MFTFSRITVWLGLVMASLTSLLPVGGLTVCFGHEIQHQGHTQQHGHGVIVAVGADYQSCVCGGSASNNVPTECDGCLQESRQCNGFAVERPEVASADDPVRRESSDSERSIVGCVAVAHNVVAVPHLAIRHVAWLPPPSEVPRVAPWLERSTVLIL